MKKCDHCKEYKEDEEFNWRYKNLSIRHNTCRECKHTFDKKYFEGPAKKRHLANVRERTEGP
jgi:uncharacterized protein YlaI